MEPGHENHGAASFDDNYIYSVFMGGKVHKWELPYNQVQIITGIDFEVYEIVVRDNKMYLVEIFTGEI